MANKKVALVTGAGVGIGRAIAVRLAKDGYDLVINDLNEDTLLQTEAAVKAQGGDCLSVKADVSDNGQVKAMFDQLIEQYGRIDVLINNAGICPVCDILDMPPEGFARTMSINVDSVYICSYNAIPYMIKQGGGRIINAASAGAFTQSAKQVAYCTSKWAVRGLTRQLAAALAKYNITVNAYCPGATDTPMQAKICESASKEMGMTVEEYRAWKVSPSRVPMGRWIEEDEVAGVVSFVASEAAAGMTGLSIPITAGYIMI